MLTTSSVFYKNGADVERVAKSSSSPAMPLSSLFDKDR